MEEYRGQNMPSATSATEHEDIVMDAWQMIVADFDAEIADVRVERLDDRAEAASGTTDVEHGCGLPRHVWQEEALGGIQVVDALAMAAIVVETLG